MLGRFPEKLLTKNHHCTLEFQIYKGTISELKSEKWGARRGREKTSDPPSTQRTSTLRTHRTSLYQLLSTHPSNLLSSIPAMVDPESIGPTSTPHENLLEYCFFMITVFIGNLLSPLTKCIIFSTQQNFAQNVGKFLFLYLVVYVSYAFSYHSQFSKNSLC